MIRLASALAVMLTANCTLDPLQKTACGVKTDCLGGDICDNGTCRRPTATGFDPALGSGDSAGTGDTRDAPTNEVSADSPYIDDALPPAADTCDTCALNTSLHGKVEPLGGNRVRVTYDFETAEQFQDFVGALPPVSAASLAKGRLVVGPNNLAARLVKGFKAESVRYEAEILSGDHINVYLAVHWDGAWSPARGYGAIHNSGGGTFVWNAGPPSDFFFTPAVLGNVDKGRIDATKLGLTWTLNGDKRTLTVPYYGGTTQSVAFGGFNSTVAFDNLVIEGHLQ